MGILACKYFNEAIEKDAFRFTRKIGCIYVSLMVTYPNNFKWENWGTWL